jgi:hypothetical protein
MTALTWDNVGERLYEAGVDHGVLYLPDEVGAYDDAHVWNGLTTVTESPSGAESNKQYADNIAYLNLLSAEDFGATIEAFTYPDAFAECDGTAVPTPGVSVGQQGRKAFGLAYRTKVGNDLEGVDHGYKLHLLYGAQASPSEKAYGTINDSPEAITFSWELTTTPVPVNLEVDGVELKPTASLVIDSTKVDATALGELEDILFGTVSDDARLPGPAEVIALFTDGVLQVDLTVSESQPTFVEATGVATLPAVTGVQWKQGGVNKAPGPQTAIAPGSTTTIRATAQPGYNLVGDDTWTFQRDA